jgi:hypothetical protein
MAKKYKLSPLCLLRLLSLPCFWLWAILIFHAPHASDISAVYIVQIWILLALLLIWRHEYISVLPPAAVKTVHSRDPYMASNSFRRYCLQWGCNFSGFFFIFSTFFLLCLLVPCSHIFFLLLQGTVPFLFKFRSFSSCVCPFISRHILSSTVSYARNKLFHILALFCMVTNYWRRMWSRANCRWKIGEN